jgi:hypothetical protein
MAERASFARESDTPAAGWAEDSAAAAGVSAYAAVPMLEARMIAAKVCIMTISGLGVLDLKRMGRGGGSVMKAALRVITGCGLLPL